jgi:hypothetical protein
MWYCVCLAAGFIGGVVTALLVAANNKAKADQVIERAGVIERSATAAAENVEQAVRGGGTQ